MVRATTVEIERYLKKLCGAKNSKSTIGELFARFVVEYPKMAKEIQDEFFYIKSARNELFHTIDELDDRKKFVRSARQVIDRLDKLEKLKNDLKVQEEKCQNIKAK